MSEKKTLVLLGAIQTHTEKTALVESKAALCVLEPGVAVFLADGTLLGAITDVIGSVDCPFYVVDTEQEAREEKNVFYDKNRSSFIDIEKLSLEKGVDVEDDDGMVC
ncbi:MAG: uncharacterized protein A8A55_0022 [Amphiamblys sp. WSBS2006]|nr:MAG: uncharacterized protein A8A55_0022 [Amphiamblys sp. WSBS2006]